MSRQQWNDLFSYKIKESEWRRPTEDQVTLILLCYIKKFDYNTLEMSNQLSSETEQSTKLKLKLCNIINKFYKISSDRNIFQYTDLIHPSPKKIHHLIMNLMNYYLWYKQTRGKITEKAEAFSNEYNESRKQLQQLTKAEKNMETKSKKVMQEETLKKSKLLPLLAIKLDTLKNNLYNLSKNKEALIKSNKICEENAEKYRDEYKDLEEKVISDDEYISLLQKENSLERELNELNLNIESEQNNKKISSMHINEMTPVFAEIEDILLTNLEPFITTTLDGNLKVLEKELQEKSKIKEIIFGKINETTERIKEFQEKNYARQMELEILNSNLFNKKKEILQSMETTTKEISCIEKVLANSNLILLKEEDLGNVIGTYAKNILREQLLFL